MFIQENVLRGESHAPFDKIGDVIHADLGHDAVDNVDLRPVACFPLGSD
jgi:hypothetical protein